MENIRLNNKITSYNEEINEQVVFTIECLAKITDQCREVEEKYKQFYASNSIL